MRICLVTHGFPPIERTGVENYTAGLARAFARAGHTVEVFAPRRDALMPNCGIRREMRDGVAINWIALNTDPEGPREMLDRPAVAAEFGRFLERERPEIVHFQHVVKLGVGLILEASRRGIPSLYTAHDYYSVCHRYTLLRPDLAHCDVRGDFMACARCDLALSFLNGLGARLGDYQMGALAEQLSAEERGALVGILADEPEPAGFSQQDLDAACDQRRELDASRARAFNALDLILAPTVFLREELVRGGIERNKIAIQPYGIENEDLVALPSIRGDPGAAVRFGYLGGLSKHKGAHVLLEAFARLRSEPEPRAELTLYGMGTDAKYEERLRERAAEVGARFGGPYEREHLPRLLADLDVVIVPSIWVENYPLVIREAFSARRPVLASRFGALSESVRDGVDGLLFEPDNPEALAAVMRRVASEPGLLERLAEKIERVKTVEEEASELVARYRQLIDARERTAEVELPSSLQGFVRRFERLRALPTRELFARALSGVERLRAEFAPETGDPDQAELLLGALGESSSAQTLIRDLRRANEWLSDTTEHGTRQGELTRSMDEAQLSFREAVERLRAMESALSSTEQSLQDREERLSKVEAQFRTTAELGLQALRTQARLLSSELWPILKNMAELTAEDVQKLELPSQSASTPELLAAFRGRIQALEFLRRELVWRRDLVEKLDAETRWRREQMTLLSKEVEWRRKQMDELETHADTLYREVIRRVSESDRRAVELRALRVETDLRSEVIAELKGSLEEIRAEFAHLEQELTWRRGEMEAASEAARRVLVRGLIAPTGLGRRISRWKDGRFR